MTFEISYPWPEYEVSANGRGNRNFKAALTKKARQSAAKITHEHGLDPVCRAIPKIITSHPPSERWDKDNARSITKPILDGIADAIGVNDREFDVEPLVGDTMKGGAIVVQFEEIPTL